VGVRNFRRVAMCISSEEVVTLFRVLGFLSAVGGWGEVMACGYLEGCQRLC
jgi:hypothetical protein